MKMADQLSVYQELESKVSEHGSMDKSEMANVQLQSCKNSQWAFAILLQDHFCSCLARCFRETWTRHITLLMIQTCLS